MRGARPRSSRCIRPSRPRRCSPSPPPAMRCSATRACPSGVTMRWASSPAPSRSEALSSRRGPCTEATMGDDDVRAELARLKAENEQLKARQGRAANLKVSEKGALSVYGLGRFPVTLYKEQWTRLLDMADD